MAKLGDFAYIKGRIGWRGLKADEYTNDGPFLIAGNHIQNGQIDWPNCDHISMHRYNESWEIALKEKDIILTKDGTIGRVAIIKGLPGLATINSTMMLVRVNNPLQPEYVYHYLNSNAFQKLVDDRVSGSSIPHIFQRDMVTLEIPIPTIDEQCYIAEILDTIDEAIKKTEALIAKLKVMKQGLLQDLLASGIDKTGNLRDPKIYPEQFKVSELGKIPKDWSFCEIRSILKFITDYRGKTPPHSSSGIPVITAENVIDGEIRNISKYVTQKTYKKWTTRGFHEPGDVIITTEAPVGEVAQAPDFTCLLTRRVIALRPIEEKVRKRFLYWHLYWLSKKAVWAPLSHGSTVPRILKPYILCYQLRIPQLKEQDRIVQILDCFDARYKEEKKCLTKLILQKKGLMHDMLAGKVRVKEQH